MGCTLHGVLTLQYMVKYGEEDGPIFSRSYDRRALQTPTERAKRERAKPPNALAHFVPSFHRPMRGSSSVVAVLFVLLCAGVHGFGLRPARRSVVGARSSLAMAAKSSPAAVFAAVALTTSLVFNGGSHALADLSDEESEITMNVRTISVSSGPAAAAAAATEAKSATKVAVVGVSTSGSGSESDMDYGASLKKEKAKQEARKKDKVSRSKDLCESLGRGC